MMLLNNVDDGAAVVEVVVFVLDVIVASQFRKHMSEFPELV